MHLQLNEDITAAFLKHHETTQSFTTQILNTCRKQMNLFINS